MVKDFADNIIDQLEQDYDTIASHFSNTRNEPWPEFASLKTLTKTANTKLLDVGCGNGRLADVIQVADYTGLDLSSQLLQIAQQRFPDYTFVHGSVLQLPFPDKQFDIVTCVATLQHIPSIEYRQKALQEMARVLKPGGMIFMLNWNLAEQPQYQPYRADQTKGYDAGDYLIPWKNDQGEVLAQRYYHGFGIAEIASTIGGSASGGELKIIKNELGENGRNIVSILKKTSS